jgi:hypothetical protein
MDQKNSKSYIGIVIMLGAVWGLSEAALGMWLRSCASFMSGSIMTGVALFFIAASWILSRRILGVALLIAIACLFKMFDALLPSRSCGEPHFRLSDGGIGIPGSAHHICGKTKAQNRKASYSRRNVSALGSQPLSPREICDWGSSLRFSWDNHSSFPLLCAISRYSLLRDRTSRILGSIQDYDLRDKT